MERPKFEWLVRQAIEDLPDEIRLGLDNVDVVVEDLPTSDQLVGSGLDVPDCLLGLYEGIPLPDRYGYNLVLPDKITLFQRSIEAICLSDQEVLTEIRDTVIHEVAHHFGIDDDALDNMGV
ncbi:metallopeptidase family protein [Dehalococcoidia bacterium]|nr:metallopeptidase family protein [Dehalococcoidia bacterium]